MENENGESMIYVGCTESSFLNEERTTTSHYSILKKYKNCRKLASHVCEMKEKDRSPSVRWRILRKAKLYKNGNNMCRLC